MFNTFINTIIIQAVVAVVIVDECLLFLLDLVLVNKLALHLSWAFSAQYGLCQSRCTGRPWSSAACQLSPQEDESCSRSQCESHWRARKHNKQRTLLLRLKSQHPTALNKASNVMQPWQRPRGSHRSKWEWDPNKSVKQALILRRLEW